MPSELTNRCREAFEIWFSHHTKMRSAPPRFKDGYLHHDPEVTWAAWQEAWKQSSEYRETEKK